MNAIFRLAAGALLAAGTVVAGPPANRVVVLDNENLVLGEVTRGEEGYQVRRADGGEITLPARRVVAVVADAKAAYAVVAGRADRRDADERMRLARWCADNGLTEDALAEAKAAASMRPGFAAAEQLVRSLEAMPSTKPTAVPARAEMPAKDAVEDVPAIEYNSESYPLFASKVNSILVNACASCHARDDVKSFRLTRLGGRAGITKNLTAALAQVNPADSMASPILTKSVTAHGSAAEAPFKTRAHPAYQGLESWARIARAPEGSAAPPRKLPDLETAVPAGGKRDAFGEDSKTPPRQARDEFDPAIFNEQTKTSQSLTTETQRTQRKQ